MSDYGASSAPGQEPPGLQARYRRVLSIGDLLDASIQLFRLHWRRFALINAIALAPVFIVLIALGIGAAAVITPNLVQNVGPGSVTALLPIIFSVVGIFVVLAFFLSLVWTAAVTRTTELYMNGEQPTIGGVYSYALNRVLPVFGAGLLFGLAMVVLVMMAGVIMVVTLFFIGVIVAAIGLLVWALSPGSRRSWLKWLIVIATPMGLPLYMGVMWSMFVPAAVIEKRGPVDALSRSYDLVEGKWFRTFVILFIAGLIVSVLQSAPRYIVEFPLDIATRGSRDAFTTGAVLAVSSIVGFVFQIIFSSLGTITYTLLFVDLRNRREGTDIAERLTQLETP